MTTCWGVDVQPRASRNGPVHQSTGDPQPNTACRVASLRSSCRESFRVGRAVILWHRSITLRHVPVFHCELLPALPINKEPRRYKKGNKMAEGGRRTGESSLWNQEQNRAAQTALLQATLPLPALRGSGTAVLLPSWRAYKDFGKYSYLDEIMSSYSPLKVNRCFGEMFCRHLQSITIIPARKCN
jgi:hypothetical protein